MTTETFISRIKLFQSKSDLIKIYPIENTKVLQRFWERLFWMPDVNKLSNSWLGDLYKQTNGVDLLNYYIVPYNNLL